MRLLEMVKVEEWVFVATYMPVWTHGRDGEIENERELVYKALAINIICIDKIALKGCSYIIINIFTIHILYSHY